MKGTKTKIAHGLLSWPRKERISDRYGVVAFWPDDVEGKLVHKDSKVFLDEILRLKGKKGSLVAIVLEARKSKHIGDMFRGLSPSTPDVGEEILLGKGTLYHEAPDSENGEAHCVGLSQKRDHDWLNPKSLYRVHEQIVDLYFIEA